MAMRDPRETLISWLNDAYSLERSLVEVLENHAKDARDSNHPEAARRITQHLEETKMHAERVKDCVERLGGSTSSVKTAMGKVTGFFQGLSTGAAPDEMVKNGLSDYAAEHFEIASYRALIAAATALGETGVASICQDILRDEENMAKWLESQLPMMVQEYLGAPAGVGASGASGMGGVGGTGSMNPGGSRF
jgi:ferritin-like metal-binding protein YciE